MGENGRAFVVREYSREKLARLYLDGIHDRIRANGIPGMSA
jgi:hypothetical protein